MKNVLKALVKAMKLIFIVFCLFTGSLCFRQQRLPGEFVEWICAQLSSEEIVVGCESASIGFREGVYFQGLRVYDRTRRDRLTPVISADSISVGLITRKVRMVALKMPRLHDGYYYPDSETGKVASVSTSNPAKEISLPRLPKFTLELIRPDILGVAPEHLSAMVMVSPRKIDVQSIRLDWPDQEVRMWLDGFCTVDFDAHQVVGNVRGTATQAHIRPLLVALDLPVSYQYMGGYPDTGTDGFTGVIGPVPAYCGWKADLNTREFYLDLDLHPDMGRYNNVRMRHVDGKIGVHVYFTDAYMGYDITVGPIAAVDPNGRFFGGRLVVHGTNNLDYLEFDARSELDKQDTLDIIGYLNHGVFDDIHCRTPPHVTARGVFNCDDVNIANNDMGGEFRVDKLEFERQELSDVRFDYRLKGSEVTISRFSAKGVAGGDISATVTYHVPIADGDEEFSGSGRIDIHNGKLVRVPIFLALTSALADNVPGIDKLVNQSEASCTFTISNGVYRTEDLVVQGALFCIKMKGTCKLETDEIDFIAHCTVLKDESVLGGYLIQPVLWPFTKLLTEFHVTGTSANPKLQNTSFKTFTDTVGGLRTSTGEFINKVFDR